MNRVISCLDIKVITTNTIITLASIFFYDKIKLLTNKKGYFMADTPEAPAEAPKAPESVETPTTTNNNEPAPAQTSAPIQAPDMHGFTSEQLADMKKFFDNNGGFDAIKSKISNPEKPAEKPAETQEPEKKEPTSPTHEPATAPVQGAITASEFLAEQYFKSLAGEEKYAGISKGIRDGEYLKEMAAFGIKPLNQDGSINDQKVRMYLDLKAQTVPATPTGTEPNANNAPTKTYTEVGDAGFTDINQAYKVLMEPGNPNIAKAEEFIRNSYNPDSQKNK